MDIPRSQFFSVYIAIPVGVTNFFSLIREPFWQRFRCFTYPFRNLLKCSPKCYNNNLNSIFFKTTHMCYRLNIKLYIIMYAPQFIINYKEYYILYF